MRSRGDAPLPIGDEVVGAGRRVGALALAKGARMPSTADDDCAEMRKAAFRATADLR